MQRGQSLFFRTVIINRERDFASLGTFGKIWNIFGSHTEWGRKGCGAADIQWVEASNAAEDAAMRWTTPTSKINWPQMTIVSLLRNPAIK